MNWKTMLTAVLAVVVLAGCGGDDDDDRRIAGNQQQTFTAFTKSLLKSTDDTADPVSVNDKALNFNDKDDPEAYDDVLSSR